MRRNAAQAAVKKGLRGSGRGGAAHTTPAPTTARVEPASHPVASRAALAGGSAAPAVATGARRQYGAAPSLAPPRCNRPRSPRCQGAEGEAGAGTRSRGAGGLRGATHSPRLAPPLHASASRPRPRLSSAHVHSLRLRPQNGSAPFRTLPPKAVFLAVASTIFATFGTQPADVFQSHIPKGRHCPAPVPACPTLPCMAAPRQILQVPNSLP